MPTRHVPARFQTTPSVHVPLKKVVHIPPPKVVRCKITRYGDRFEYASPEETPALMADLVDCFDKEVTVAVIHAMADKMSLRVIFRDSCFAGGADKINIYETFRQLMDWSDQEVVKNIRVI